MSVEKWERQDERMEEDEEPSQASNVVVFS